ncbi:alpha/beta fold hydrolase [Pseudoclavibacter sp. JSM 162008]|uniref:alpha/beta fold hydrolase n=1 Tax=Pseudoclavibacter sp. JSM 162008 TaxID=3229855 RepID=UPI003526095C
MANFDGHLGLGGCTIWFSDTGPGAVPGSVVLLHGAGADHTMFERQAAALRRAGHRVVLVDLRGHGRSRPTTIAISPELLASDIERLIAHLDLGEVSLVGHSLGGNLAQELVRRAPERYGRLAVLDATWNAGPLTVGERAALRLAGPMLRLIPSARLPQLMADASATTASARGTLTRTFASMSKGEFIAVWRATTEFVRPDASYRTPVPTLLVRGERDTTGNIARAMPAWAAADRLTEVVIPDAGHVVTMDAPEATSEALLTFLA